MFPCHASSRTCRLWWSNCRWMSRSGKLAWSAMSWLYPLRDEQPLREPRWPHATKRRSARESHVPRAHGTKARIASVPGASSSLACGGSRSCSVVHPASVASHGLQESSGQDALGQTPAEIVQSESQGNLVLAPLRLHRPLEEAASIENVDRTIEPRAKSHI